MDEVERLASEIEKREARLDILVNNAGASWGGDFASFPEAGWDKIVDLNVKSVFFLTQRLLKLLEKAGPVDEFSRVINIGSIDGMHPRSRRVSNAWGERNFRWAAANSSASGSPSSR